MANITISYPDIYQADAVASLRELLGADADGLTDSVAVKKAVKRWVKSLVKGYRRRNAASVGAAVVSADAALAAREAAALTAVQARKDAEVAADASVETAFGSDS